jgi:hypothetical protein
MIKALLKYLLSACILLLSGHSFLHAHANQDRIRHSSIKNLETSALAGFCIVQNSLTPMIRSLSSGREKENNDLNALVVCDNDDDDELISFKKHPGSSHYSASIFFAQTSGYFSGHGKKTTPSYQRFSYAPSYRHLVFRAFRI